MADELVREGDASSILAMLIDVASSQLDLQLAASDSHDVKALGLLAANVGSAALGITLAPSWTLWWIYPDRRRSDLCLGIS